MEWVGEGCVLGVRPHGETSVVLEAMTAERGRHLGLVKGGRGPKLAGLLQAGNTLRLTWRARLDEHLGAYAVDLVTSRTVKVMESRLSTYALASMTGLMRYLPERDPHPRLHALCELILNHLDDAQHIGALMARFELTLLDELGFGLDLTSCASTGATEDLIYVSPKSGRAVCREAGRPYAQKMLPLPAFLLSQEFLRDVARQEVASAFRLTGFFLERHFAVPRNIPLPAQRDGMISLMGTKSPLDEAIDLR